MAKPLLPDALWDRIRPLLPTPPKPKRPDRPGRKRYDDRLCLTGILFVLKTGISWEDLPRELGCGSGMTCWRRLAYWTAAGSWPKVHALLLSDLEWAGAIDWSRATIHGLHARPRGGGETTGPGAAGPRSNGNMDVDPAPRARGRPRLRPGEDAAGCREEDRVPPRPWPPAPTNPQGPTIQRAAPGRDCSPLRFSRPWT